MSLSELPKRWRIATFLWTAAICVAVTIFYIKHHNIREYKALTFFKEKEARRGKIRKAREGTETFSITQERIGVTRSCFLEDPSGLRRQFLLEAKTAQVTSYITKKNSSLKELFFQPKGYLQEELFFEISSTGEKVIRKDDTWVSATPPFKPVPGRFYREVVPMQQVRFFDAATAEWTLSTNELVAYTAFFSILKVPGHELPSSPEAGKTLSKGTARAITFSFDKKGRQIVKSEGVKLHLGDAK